MKKVLKEAKQTWYGSTYLLPSSKYPNLSEGIFPQDLHPQCTLANYPLWQFAPEDALLEY